MSPLSENISQHPEKMSTRRAFLRFVLPVLLLLLLLAGSAYVYFFLPGNDLTAIHTQTGREKLFSFESAENAQYLAQASQVVITNPAVARDIAMDRLSAIEKNGKDKDKIPFYNMIGVSYLYQAQYNNAIKEFYNSMELALELNEPLYLAHTHHNIGLVNLFSEKYKDAIDFFLKSLEIYEHINDTINMYTAMNSIGRIYYEINDLGKAYSYYAKAWDGFLRYRHELGISSVANHKAMYYQAIGQPDSTIHYFNQAILYGKKVESNFNLSDIYLEKGNFYFHTANYPRAISNYHISDSLAQVVNSPRQACYPKLGIAMAYLEMNNTDQAMTYVEAVSQINQQIENDEISFRISETLSSIYEHQGNITRAFEHYKLANEKRSKLYDQTEIYQVYNVELEQLNRQMELNQLTMERQELLLSQRKNTMVLIIVISVSLLIILSLLYKFYINKIKQLQKNKLHENQIRHSREKNRAALEAETSERKRLGLELHDGVGPLISLTKLNVTNVIEDDTLSTERKHDLLKKTASNLDEILREMKHISYNLAPLVLMERGFEYAIRNLAAKIKNLRQYDVHLNINGVDKSLGTYHQHALYRTIQEMLNNVILHAEAREINMEILQNDHDITVMIEDDGKGFEVCGKATGQGLGLKSAASRIEGLGGEFLIDSKPGRGTIITIILPLEKQYAPFEANTARSQPNEKPEMRAEAREKIHSLLMRAGLKKTTPSH
ncbi:MAG: hypothetical protein EA361_18645 [Bacteroidetes bacterium]|nr:MAG: hypothetical protein EA361_18645 [Bacteroidota bacterium]